MKLKAIILIAALTIGVSTAFAAPVKPDKYFTDYAGVVSQEQAYSLNEKLANLEKETTNQFLVVVYPSLNGNVLESFTVDACKSWGVGQQDKNNGMVLFVFPHDRKMRFEVGYGLESVITDSQASSIIRNKIAPYFKAGDFYAGINSGVDSVIQSLTPKVEAVSEVTQPDLGFAGAIFLGLVIAVVCILIIIRIMNREPESYNIEPPRPIYVPRSPKIYNRPSTKVKDEVESLAIPVAIAVAASSVSKKPKKKSQDDDSYSRRSSSYDSGSSSSSSSSFDGGSSWSSGGGDFGGGGASGGW
jgi:uncharacterized protein